MDIDVRTIALELLIGIVAILLIFGATQYILNNWLGIKVSIVGDLWSELKRIPDTITSAIDQIVDAIAAFIASPFKAFADTLAAWGLPPELAQGMAIAIIVGIIGLVLLAVARWRGWI